jgi:two-component system, cell cycle sensor histidine kinase and response regulator CckA
MIDDGTSNDRRIRALVEHGTDCIVLIGEDERIQYVSPALLRSLGYEAREMLGASANAFLHPDDVPSVDDIRGAQPGDSVTGTVRLRHKDGSWRWHEGTARNLLDDPAIRAYVCNRRDVTDRVQLEQQLRQSQKMEAIGLLAGGVAHDFNNLLAAILGFAELATRKVPGDHAVQGHLREVIEAGRRGGELTRKLLTFSKRQINQPKPLDVQIAIGNLGPLLQRLLGEDVVLSVECSPEALVVEADSVQFEQVLLNLCTNARHAMPEGGTLRIATRAASFDEAFVQEHPWSRRGSFAEIAVSDTGVGMDDATRARIFEPFFTTKPEGSGLGLATVYGIVEQHRGFIRVESSRASGTTFWLYLPQTAERAVQPSPASPARTDRLPVHGEWVLLAEDEPSLRRLMTLTLTDLGYRVITTNDGDQAVEEFTKRSGEVSLVLLDVVMPRLGAREAYEKMSAIRPDVPVLFMTGYAPESTRLRELLVRDNLALLEKPFTMAALAEKVRRAIDRRGF